MKKLLVALGLFVLTFFGCNQSKETVLAEIEGHYVGVFERNGKISTVEINLADQEFSGESDTSKFPAICSGSYKVSHSTITFENKCMWTANFDWTLILKETWNYSFENDELILTKPNGDNYLLKRR